MAELNGRPLGLEQLQTLALTNYGHFTSLRVDEGRVRGLALHLDRLVRDCRVLFGVDLDTERVLGLIRRAVPPHGATTIRVTVFDPATDLGRPSAAVDPQILVTERAAGALPLPALRVQSATYARDTPEVKSVGLFGSLRARRTAQLNGFDDALFIDGDGLIAEGGTWNIGFFDGDHVIWPDADCLEGVTMKLLQKVHAHRVGPVTIDDLPSMQAAFATNAAIGLRAIAQINENHLSVDHSIIEILRKEYNGIVGDLI
ncbi:aminotransferase class IV family protein [Streptomyces sp. NPDC088725]|uniref:aminotransferase class IV family protein n=1 Tax=Streptomyces sp. NPDC088725 TaxID=3365873 RepID=UPI0038243A49